MRSSLPANADASREHAPFTLDLTAIVEVVTATVVADVLAELERRAEPWPRYMSVPTASRYLDITQERLRKLIGRRAVPFHQEAPTCRIFLSRSDLDAWMDGRRISALPERSN